MAKVFHPKMDMLTVNSLDKVFGARQPELFETANSMPANEVFSFQILLRVQDDIVTDGGKL